MLDDPYNILWQNQITPNSSEVCFFFIINEYYMRIKLFKIIQYNNYII